MTQQIYKLDTKGKTRVWPRASLAACLTGGRSVQASRAPKNVLLRCWARPGATPRFASSNTPQMEFPASPW